MVERSESTHEDQSLHCAREWGLGTATEGTHRGANKDSGIAEKSLKGKPTNCMNLKALNS